jgi:hypothetical protein
MHVLQCGRFARGSANELKRLVKHGTHDTEGLSTKMDHRSNSLDFLNEVADRQAWYSKQEAKHNKRVRHFGADAAVHRFLQTPQALKGAAVRDAPSRSWRSKLRRHAIGQM